MNTDKKTDMKCHYIHDKVAGRVLIPGCMGATIRGVEGCTCGSSHFKSTEEGVYNLEKRVNELLKK